MPLAAAVSEEPPGSALGSGAAAAADGPTSAFSSSAADSAIEPLPEQSLSFKLARHSLHTLSWMSILATVEIQLVLRCLDFRSRLTAARCNKQLYAAASHPFV